MRTMQQRREREDVGAVVRHPPAAAGIRDVDFSRTLRLALFSAGGAMALVLAVDGAWPWRIVRVGVVGAVVSALLTLGRIVGQRTRGLLFAVVGLVAATAGTAIGMPFLARDGWSLRSDGGLLAGAAGVVLFIFGSVVAIRSVHGWRRVVAVPIAMLGAYSLGSPVAISVYATNVPRPTLGSRTPADYGLGYDDASFVTADGIRLSGWYIPSTNRAAVVLLHGASSTRSNVLEEAVVLARHGYGVLLFDARGFGGSDGRAMNLGWWGDRDINAAVSYLEGRPDVDPNRIGAVGSSMGGEEAIGAMAADGRVRAAVAEGATGRVAADLAWLSDRYGVRGLAQEAVNTLTYAITDVLTSARPPLTLRSAAAAAAPRPILLVVAGKVDEEAYAAAAMREAAPGNVDVWVVPGSTHTAGLQTQPAQWEERVIGFLDAALVAGR